jgi:hypothetical protein
MSASFVARTASEFTFTTAGNGTLAAALLTPHRPAAAPDLVLSLGGERTVASDDNFSPAPAIFAAVGHY